MVHLFLAPTYLASDPSPCSSSRPNYEIRILGIITQFNPHITFLFSLYWLFVFRGVQLGCGGEWGQMAPFLRFHCRPQSNCSRASATDSQPADQTHRPEGRHRQSPVQSTRFG
jgi:hypothetical protein